jgi:hypothetical protein
MKRPAPSVTEASEKPRICKIWIEYKKNLSPMRIKGTERKGKRAGVVVGGGVIDMECWEFMYNHHSRVFIALAASRVASLV